MYYIQTIDFTHREKFANTALTFNQVLGGSLMLEQYRKHADEHAAMGIPSLPLDAQQSAAFVELLKTFPTGVEIS